MIPPKTDNQRSEVTLGQVGEKCHGTGADPGFPVGRTQTLKGAPTYDFVKNSKKLHEIKIILGHGRVGGGRGDIRQRCSP